MSDFFTHWLSSKTQENLGLRDFLEAMGVGRFYKSTLPQCSMVFGFIYNLLKNIELGSVGLIFA